MGRKILVLFLNLGIISWFLMAIYKDVNVFHNNLSHNSERSRAHVDEYMGESSYKIFEEKKWVEMCSSIVLMHLRDKNNQNRWHWHNDTNLSGTEYKVQTLSIVFIRTYLKTQWQRDRVLQYVLGNLDSCWGKGVRFSPYTI